jgi:hypothetical protein
VASSLFLRGKPVNRPFQLERFFSRLRHKECLRNRLDAAPQTASQTQSQTDNSASEGLAEDSRGFSLNCRNHAVSRFEPC